ncbi:MAG: histidine triad nucleotide-binding protein [Candidatus Omnitrophota bacterium]
MTKDTCLFCKIVKRDIPAKIVFEDNKILAFEDIRPQAPVHIVIIPKYHIDRISDANEENIHLIGSLMLAAGNIARSRKIDASGYRIVVNCNKDGGQEVYHLHLHLLGGRPMTWPPG